MCIRDRSGRRSGGWQIHLLPAAGSPGQMCIRDREYLREVHPARLNTLILTGELWTYLADLNEQAQERLDTIMEQMLSLIHI